MKKSIRILALISILTLLSGCLCNTKVIREPYPVPGPTEYIPIEETLLERGRIPTAEETRLLKTNEDWVQRDLKWRAEMLRVNSQLDEIEKRGKEADEGSTDEE